MTNKIKTQLESAVKILDSITITIADKRASWASYRESKSGVKVHILLDEALSLVEDFKVTAAKIAGLTIAKTFEFISGHIGAYPFWRSRVS